MSQNNRRNPRSPVRLMAFVKNLKTLKVERWLTKNISGTGLCIISNEDIARGTRLEVELKLPDYNTPFVLTGEVVWTMTSHASEENRGTGNVELGILFLNPPDKVKSMLNQYAVMNAPPETG